MRLSGLALLPVSILVTSGCGTSNDAEEAAVYAAYVNANLLDIPTRSNRMTWL